MTYNHTKQSDWLRLYTAKSEPQPFTAEEIEHAEKLRKNMRDLIDKLEQSGVPVHRSPNAS